MLKKTQLLLFIGLLPQIFFAQDDMPNSVDDVIEWKFTITYEDNEAILNMTAVQKDHWHVYSQVQPDKAVAYPTGFIFEENSSYELINLKSLEKSHKQGKDKHRSELCSLYIRENQNTRLDQKQKNKNAPNRLEIVLIACNLKWR